jgi:hypothetical protein
LPSKIWGSARTAQQAEAKQAKERDERREDRLGSAEMGPGAVVVQELKGIEMKGVISGARLCHPSLRTTDDIALN